MARDKAAENQVAGEFAGLTLDEMIEKFESNGFRKLWKRLSEDVRKNILIKTNVVGAEDVEDLIQAFDRCAGASEEYFKKIDKYRGVQKAIGMAFKEGSVHMKEYLEEAGKNGGKIAIIAAASSFLLKSLSEQASKFKESVLELKHYNIEQEKFQRTSNKSAGEVASLRDSLNLTRSDMESFFSVMKKSETLGFGGDQLKETFQSLKEVYGDDAMKMIQDYQDLLSHMPDLNLRIKMDPSSKMTSDDLYEIMSSGNIDKVIEFKAAGLLGGTKEESKNAKFENTQKKIDYTLEKIKDSINDSLPTATLYLAQLNKTATDTLNIITEISVIVGALSVLESLPSLFGQAGTIARVGGAFGGAAGTTLGGLGIGAGLAVGIGGGALAAGGAALTYEEKKTREDNGYTPSIGERWKAVFGDRNSDDARINRGYGLSWSENKSSEDMFNEKVPYNNRKEIGQEGPKFNSEGQRVSGKTRNTKEYSGRVKDLNSMSASAKVFEKMNMDMERYEAKIQDSQESAKNFMEIADVVGDSKGYFQEMTKYTEVTKERWAKDQELVAAAIANAEAIDAKGRESMGKEAYEQTDTYNMNNNLILKGRNELLKKHKEYNEAMLETLNAATFLANEGAVNSTTRRGLQRGASFASSMVDVSRREGGEFGALQTKKQADINLAKDTLAGKKNAIAFMEEKLNMEKDLYQRNVYTQQLVQLDEERAQAEEALTEALKDTSAWDFVTERIQNFQQVLESTEKYVKDINGSFTELNPVWEEQLNMAKKEADVKNNIFEEMKNQGEFKPGTTKYNMAEQEALKASISAAQEQLAYAIKVRDAKKEEIEFASGWLKEQADYVSEMGGSFGDVLMLRAKGIQKEREEIAVLDDYLKTSGETGFKREQMEVALERKKMDLTKQTIGAQKDAFEKFAGMAFGAMSDSGFKRGRMTDSVLMGTANTRVKNQAGLFTGAGVGLTRDQLSAVNSSGGFNPGTTIGGLKRDENIKTPSQMLNMEAQKKQLESALATPAQKVDVKTEIIVSASSDFMTKVKETVRSMAKDQSFVRDILNSGNVVTTEQTKGR